MKDGKIFDEARKRPRPYRITDGKRFRLKNYDPRDTGDMDDADKPRALDALNVGKELLAELQTRLYAQNQWAVLLIFQAMDAAGKDSAIKHVMSGVNPSGCQVFSFKAPSEEELDHDFLWRCATRLPERGRIGIFNRSYYEEVLVVRVHPEILDRQKLPPELVSKRIWAERHDDICSFERYLARNGVKICKFFLNVSRAEQKKRFLERLEDPEKHWKFSADDVRQRKYWKQYMAAFEDMIRHTASKVAPWYVVPADNKWYTRIVVANVVIDTLASLDLKYPRLAPASKRELEKARQELLAER